MSRRPARPAASPRDAAVRVVRVLVDAGHRALFAGGCVRDRLMGHEPKDYDVATDARPEQVQGLFRRTASVGESFGVILVRLMGRTVEVATFRTDGSYGDGRRPDSVEYADAPADAARRDFTINGLFEDPLTDEVIDYVGGRADLAAGVIRAIGDPAARIGEDRLRMLRAVRFASRFGFRLDGATAAAIRATADDLAGVSRERIGDEMQRMLEHESRDAAIGLLIDLRLDASVFGERLPPTDRPRLAALPAEASYPAAVTGLLLDVHAEAPAASVDETAGRWSTALLLSNVERAGVRERLALVRALATWFERPVAFRKRAAVVPGFGEALRLFGAVDGPGWDRIESDVRDLAGDACGLAPVPLVTGRELIAWGLPPGPVFRGVLEAVYDAQLEGRVSSSAEARAFVSAFVASDAGPGN